VSFWKCLYKCLYEGTLKIAEEYRSDRYRKAEHPSGRSYAIG